ncbi:MAG: four helix bundle protein [Candidatus Paceibacterota bacterium]|jgi:four helix bundle protein
MDWQVYKEAQLLFLVVHEIVKKMPKEYRFDIGSQVLRSSLSVILNIAEGSGKSTDKDFNRYLDIAMGSLYETLACCDTLKGVKLITEQDFLKLREMIEKLASKLGAFKSKLKS